MNKVLSVRFLKEGDKFEFITERHFVSEGTFYEHPKGIMVVTQDASWHEPENKCFFTFRPASNPSEKPQLFCGIGDIEVRLLERQPKRS